MGDYPTRADGNVPLEGSIGQERSSLRGIIASEMAKKLTPEEWWRGVLTGVDPALPACTLRSIFRLIPNAPRLQVL